MWRRWEVWPGPQREGTSTPSGSGAGVAWDYPAGAEGAGRACALRAGSGAGQRDGRADPRGAARAHPGGRGTVNRWKLRHPGGVASFL